MRALAFVLALAALAGASTAHAAGPTNEWVTIDDTFTWGDCGFAVEEHDEATLHFVSWFDEAGNRTRQLVAAPGARITWTNPETGASTTTANPFVVHKHDNPDGSATIAFTGLAFALHGGGKAYVDSGREVIVFSPGTIVPISSTGPSADLCEALAATIG